MEENKGNKTSNWAI